MCFQILWHFRVLFNPLYFLQQLHHWIMFVFIMNQPSMVLWRLNMCSSSTSLRMSLHFISATSINLFLLRLYPWLWDSSKEVMKISRQQNSICLRLVPTWRTILTPRFYPYVTNFQSFFLALIVYNMHDIDILLSPINCCCLNNVGHSDIKQVAVVVCSTFFVWYPVLFFPFTTQHTISRHCHPYVIVLFAIWACFVFWGSAYYSFLSLD